MIRADAYERAAWKNGGGVTHVIAASEAWRVSVASIERDGAFSDFGGYDRTIVALDGGRVMLAFANGELRVLEPFVPYSFAGEAPVVAHLDGEPANDFNIMTRRNSCTHELTIARVTSTMRLEAGDLFGLAYVASGTAMFGESIAHCGDTIRLGPSEHARITATDDQATLIVCRVSAVTRQ